MTVELKRVTTLEIKNAERGEVESHIATLGVVDNDRDIIRHTAVRDGTPVVMSSIAHDTITQGNRPVGKGTLSVDGNVLVFKGRVFLNTLAGRETFEVLKEMRDLMQWSFGFRILEEARPTEAERRQGAHRVLVKLDAFEVSPCIMAAGVGTRTVAIKDREHEGSALTADQQAELRAIAEKVRADYERRELEQQREQAAEIGRKVLRDIAEREERERAELVEGFQSVARDYARITQQLELDEIKRRWERGSHHVLSLLSRPITSIRPEAAAVIKFAGRELGIPSEQMPTIGLVPRRALPSDSVTGVFFPATKSCYVADDLSRDELARTLIHELAHNLESLKGWRGDEAFARATEDALFARWLRVKAA
jgi:phage head maturation protease